MKYEQKYEQKYKDALERARNMLSYKEVRKEDMEYLFPELKESEDERIRKDCIKYLDWEYQHCSFNEDKMKIEKCITWLEKQSKSDETIAKMFLINKGYPIDVNGTFPTYEEIYDIIREGLEKQGEQKPDDKVEPKFYEGDWIIHQGTGNIYRVVDHIDNQYQLKYGDSYTIQKCDDVDRGARLWDISDAKDGDALCYKDEISLFKHEIINCTKQTPSFGGLVYYCCYDGKRFITNSMYSLTEQDKEDIHPATKEQRDTLFAKMKEAGYEWDDEKKELKKIEQKSVQEIAKWSIQEEYCICELEAMIKEAWRKAENIHNDVTQKKMQELMFFLKTLNPNKKPQRIISTETKEAMYDSSAWKEEDTFKVQRICKYLDESKKYYPDIIEVRECIDWLKSLKDRVGCKANYTTMWKPSNEQMEALKEACDEHWEPDGLHLLYTLYQELKKL